MKNTITKLVYLIVWNWQYSGKEAHKLTNPCDDNQYQI
jgi:hypothetical protein